MRGWGLIAVAVVMVAAAYVADRVHQAAVIHAGTYAFEPGTQQLLLAADRIPKLVLLTALGWIAVHLLRHRGLTGVAWALAGIGATVGIVPALAFAVPLGPVPPFVLDLVLPTQFVAWTGAGLVVVGLLAPVVDRLPATGPRAWTVAAAAVALLAVSWPVDAWLNATFADAASSADAIRVLVAGELVVRLAFMSALAVLGWSVLATRRAILPAVTTLVAGAVVFVGLAFVAVFVFPSPAAAPGADTLPVTGWVGRWVGGAIVLSGTWWTARSLRAPRMPNDGAEPALGSGAA